jgi:hypothetical protein
VWRQRPSSMRRRDLAFVTPARRQCRAPCAAGGCRADSARGCGSL